MWFLLAGLYRYLSFQHIYAQLGAGSQSQEIFRDGWFPFLEIIANEYRTLSRAYQAKFNIENVVKDLVKRFDGQRLSKVVTKWWRNAIFANKKSILESGIEAFLQDTSSGNITCIKTLLPEIEGVIRLQHFHDIGEDKKFDEFLSHLLEKGRHKTGSDYTLFLPLHFVTYLRDVLFAPFSLKEGQIPLSRHSSGHGVAAAKAYTRERALQAILVLDQIWYYI